MRGMVAVLTLAGAVLGAETVGGEPTAADSTSVQAPPQQVRIVVEQSGALPEQGTAQVPPAQIMVEQLPVHIIIQQAPPQVGVQPGPEPYGMTYAPFTGSASVRGSRATTEWPRFRMDREANTLDEQGPYGRPRLGPPGRTGEEVQTP
jgi:hypothetical protein